MDDTLDWRPFLDRLAAGWRVIALIALLAAGLALAWRLLDPARFRAEVILTVGRPDTPLALDPRMEASEPNPAFPYRVASLRAYPELVLSDGIAQAVIEALNRDPARHGGALSFGDIRDLQDRVEARAIADGALIAIEAHATTSQAAALLANTWAAVFIERMDAALGPGDDTGAGRPARPELRVASPAVASPRLPWGEYLRDALAAAALGVVLGAVWVLARGRRPPA